MLLCSSGALGCEGATGKTPTLTQCTVAFPQLALKSPSTLSFRLFTGFGFRFG